MATTTRTPPAWEQSLMRTVARNGAIELSPIQVISGEAPPTWRVRLLALEDGALIVERPCPGGEPLKVNPDTPLSAVILEDQNRWSFATRVIEPVMHHLNEHNRVVALRLTRPANAHSAQRRDYYRVDVAGMPTPPVQLWPLLDVASCVASEAHNDAVHRRRNTPSPPAPPPPELGEGFDGLILDISGGGMALSVPQRIEPLLLEATPCWLCIALPDLPDPLLAVARAAHWRPEGVATFRAGFRFNFDHNPEHRRTVNDQMCRLAAHYQRLQLQRKR